MFVTKIKNCSMEIGEWRNEDGDQRPGEEVPGNCTGVGQ
jgi:hypothetical protein